MINTLPVYRKLIKVVFYIISILFVIFLSFTIWVIISKQIYIKKTTERAVKEFQKDNIESLLLVIDSDKYTLMEKNRAIEVLGFYGDKRALPTLESLVTHRNCNHSEELCQYGIEKAIRKIKDE